MSKNDVACFSTVGFCSSAALQGNAYPPALKYLLSVDTIRFNRLSWSRRRADVIRGRLKQSADRRWSPVSSFRRLLGICCLGGAFSPRTGVASGRRVPIWRQTGGCCGRAAWAHRRTRQSAPSVELCMSWAFWWRATAPLTSSQSSATPLRPGSTSRR